MTMLPPVVPRLAHEERWSRHLAPEAAFSWLAAGWSDSDLDERICDNCAACHGIDAHGQLGFPNLTTTSWLWGGTPEDIAETIRVGINAPRDDTRTAQMPAWGRDKLLSRDDVEKVTAYVRSLSFPTVATETEPAVIEAGKAVFKANCVPCHGEDAKGKTEVGAPDLTGAHWTYGSDALTVYTTIWGGRQGHMPSWESRLSPLERKILALYVVDLRVPPP